MTFSTPTASLPLARRYSRQVLRELRLRQLTREREGNRWLLQHAHVPGLNRSSAPAA